MKLEDVKIGMKVRVIGTQMSHTDGWNNSWAPEMNAGVGRTFEVLSVCPFAQGIILKEISPELGHNPLDAWIFPWQVLEPVEQHKAHPDDAAVDALTVRMKAKLAKKRDKGYGGWDTYCTRDYLSELLRSHCDKGDPVDVANFCAFLSARGESIAPQPQADALDAARYRWLIDYLISDRVDLDDAIDAAKSPEEISKIIDAAIAAKGDSA